METTNVKSEKIELGMKAVTTPKSFNVTKQEVMTAWKRVKANKGSCGIDGVSVDDFELELGKNLYKLWNRMSSGSYFPKPVKRVEIPKGDGTTRPLGIPTVYDRVAQAVVQARLEKVVEPRFHPDSFGYRPGKSAHDAIKEVRQRNWKCDWVLDVDIVQFFDSLDHDLMMKAVRKLGQEKWVELYIQRWLEVPVKHSDNRLEARTKGTPQGGVISPILANLYLHYAFDLWMKKTHPEAKFIRYADDAVIHCKSEEEAEKIKESLKERLKECGLTLHPAKTKIVYCKDDKRKGSYPNISYTFLGYTFQPRGARVKKTGRKFLGFLPAASKKAHKRLRQKIRDMAISRSSGRTLQEVADLMNPVVKGWYRYFSRFYPSSLQGVGKYLDDRILRWAQRKYDQSWKQVITWYGQLRKTRPKLFTHWTLFARAYGY